MFSITQSVDINVSSSIAKLLVVILAGMAKTLEAVALKLEDEVLGKVQSNTTLQNLLELLNMMQMDLM